MGDIQTAQAPWHLKGRTWLFPVSAPSATSSFPAGWASAFQADALAAGGEFIGGLGAVQVVSYSESPVGPYDELVYVPGRWKYADGTKGFRITQIYVSTKESTINGRKNWNIPKQVASFDIRDSHGTTTIAVSSPGAPTPFFKVSVNNIPVLSSLSLPTSTSIAGSLFELVQPPLPAGEKAEEVATAQWVTRLAPLIKGSTSLKRQTPGLGGKVGDGVQFPAVVPWSIVFAMQNMTMDFPLSVFCDKM